MKKIVGENFSTHYFIFIHHLQLIVGGFSFIFLAKSPRLEGKN